MTKSTTASVVYTVQGNNIVRSGRSTPTYKTQLTAHATVSAAFLHAVSMSKDNPFAADVIENADCRRHDLCEYVAARLSDKNDTDVDLYTIDRNDNVTGRISIGRLDVSTPIEEDQRRSMFGDAVNNIAEAYEFSVVESEYHLSHAIFGHESDNDVKSVLRVDFMWKNERWTVGSIRHLIDCQDINELIAGDDSE